MAKVIFKYSKPLNDVMKFQLPRGAEILSVGNQYGKFCLWAIVDPDEALVNTTILCRGTGHELNGAEGKFLGTVQFDGGSLIFHFFEKRPYADLDKLKD